MALIRNSFEDVTVRFTGIEEHLVLVFKRVVQMEEQLAHVGGGMPGGRVRRKEEGGGDGKTQHGATSGAVEARLNVLKKETATMVDTKIRGLTLTIDSISDDLEKQTIVKNDFVKTKTLAERNERSILNLESHLKNITIATPSRK